jgi:polyhydroxyalkanoate synthase
MPVSTVSKPAKPKPDRVPAKAAPTDPASTTAIENKRAAAKAPKNKSGAARAQQNESPGVKAPKIESAAAKAADTTAAAADGMLSPGAIDALADIAKRADRLARLHAERLKTGDDYQVIDPRTVAATFREFQAGETDPARLAEAQVRLWSDLALLWQRTAARVLFNVPAEPVIAPSPQDKRFKSEAWVDNPASDYVKQFYLLMSRFLEASVECVKGVDPHTHHKQKFYTRQFLNAVAPTNFAATNPVVLKATLESRGENLIKGLRNLTADLERGNGRLSLQMSDPSAFRLGENIATSPGKVVFQNDLMQLIQYAPSTPTVHRRPLLIIPPWINKFYILDLKPKNSFIKWCSDQGHTVFVISWVNPGPELAHKGFGDYLLEGPLAALDAIAQATGEAEANLVGYCIGGTLTASVLAYMAATKDERVASATLFTTLLDFADVGDISVFLDDAQLELADEHMKRIGYFEGRHMSDAFNLLRENDLIWFFFVNNYLLGRDPAAFDLLYWNSDSTRMPTTMHSFYLRNMYYRNVLRNPGAISLADVPIDLGRIKVPLYFLSTREDHIAPWPATYAGTQLVAGPVRFVLGASGHIAGVINPPSAEKYGYWTGEALPADPRSWLEGAQYHPGSWWTDWAEWVACHGGGQVPAREPGSGKLAAIEDAPGSYVKVRGE